MSRRGSWLGALIGAPVIALGMAAAIPSAGAAAGHPHGNGVRTGLAARNPFCIRLAHKRIEASAGAFGFCFGANFRPPKNRNAAVHTGAGVTGNVNAASLTEDITPAGLRADGQSETSVAAAGRYAVEAWNDSTAFVTNCPAPMAKEEGTGFAFSTNGGKSFTDLGGLPNNDCANVRYQGDPSVAAYVVGGKTFFYITSLFDPVNGLGLTHIAMAACEVSGSGSSASLSCGQPIIVGTSTQCQKIKISKTQFIKFCSFTDKEYVAIDPARGRMYVSYSDFLLRSANGGNPVVMSVCDLGSRSGGTGPAGGTPAAPVCKHGTKLVPAGKNFLASRPYFTVAKPDPNGCENEGSYPAVDIATGNVYVGYESNWATNLGFPNCVGSGTPIQDVLSMTPASKCLPLHVTSPCPAPAATATAPVVSLDGTFVPGYNRFPSNDFPRLAVSNRFGTVSMVWNDTRTNPMGDVLLQSFRLNSLRPVQSSPVVLDQPHGGGLTMFPAVRSANRDGLLDVAWYWRPSTATPVTSVRAVIGVSPLARTTPRSVQITNVASDWINDSSLIVPNFGDYIDASIDVTGSWPYVGHTLFIAWSDGRLGIPQPFSAHLPSG
jgi:hypothetical protein